jgi:hypothetical protein
MIFAPGISSTALYVRRAAEAEPTSSRIFAGISRARYEELLNAAVTLYRSAFIFAYLANVLGEQREQISPH